MRKVVGPRDGKIRGQEVKCAARPMTIMLRLLHASMYSALSKWTSVLVARYQNWSLASFPICHSKASLREAGLTGPFLCSITSNDVVVNRPEGLSSQGVF